MKGGVQTLAVRGGRCDRVPICVMGATSALGLRIVEHLLAHTQYSVRAVVRDLNKVPPHWSFTERVNRVTWSAGSLLPDTIFDSARAIIWLVHAKGNRSGNEITLNSNALKSAYRLAASSGVRKIVFISSGGSVYGEPSELPVPEEHPRQPLSQYGEAKKRLEDLVLEASGKHGMQAAIVRPGNIYGSAAEPGVVRAFITSLLAGGPISFIANGSEIRDFVHVEDVCRAVLLAVDSPQSPVVWNAGTGVGTRVSDLLDLICQTARISPPKIHHQPRRPHGVASVVLCTKRIHAESGWLASIDLKTGIRGLLIGQEPTSRHGYAARVRTMLANQAPAAGIVTLP
jgi:UDP-glucose 4-epimerase